MEVKREIEDRDFRREADFQKIVETVEGAIKLLKSATWAQVREVVEEAGITRDRLAAAIESLNLSGRVGIERRGSLDRLHYVPEADEETVKRLYGQRPDFHKNWCRGYVSLG